MNIYRWIDSFSRIGKEETIDSFSREGSVERSNKLLAIPNWLEVIRSMIPPVRGSVCLTIQIPKSSTIPRLYPERYRQKEIQLKSPQQLNLLVEDDLVRISPFDDLNPFLAQEIADCSGLIVINLVIARRLKMPHRRSFATHVNALVIDKERKTIELFDPYGKTKPIIDRWVAEEFTQLAGLIDYNYISPIELCPYFGPQYVAEKLSPAPDSGYCMSYTLMYILMRMSNPDLTGSEINQMMMIKDWDNPLVSRPWRPDELQHYVKAFNTILHDYYQWPYR